MEDQTRFIIISTVYNKSKWITYNISSIRQQSYSNYLAVYGYDKSTDDTLEQLNGMVNFINDDRFIIYHNPNPGCFLSCFLNTYKHLKSKNLIKPEDVIVEIDGDDWLLHSYVLQHINNIYSNKKIWMTYGQYISYPTGEYGSHMYLQLDDEVDRLNTYRKNVFPYSHLKTYKAHLLDHVCEEDLINPQTGKYFTAASDFVLCMPMVEMAGKDRIFRIDEPVYVYNILDTSETNTRLEEQKNSEWQIRQLKPRTRL